MPSNQDRPAADDDLGMPTPLEAVARARAAAAPAVARAGAAAGPAVAKATSAAGSTLGALRDRALGTAKGLTGGGSAAPVADEGTSEPDAEPRPRPGPRPGPGPGGEAS